MRKTPRLLPSDLDPGPRRVYAAAALFFLLVLAALVWPVYPLFAGIRPTVMGMPFSLFWVAAWVGMSFTGLLALYLWEGRRRGDGADDGAAPGGSPSGRDREESGGAAPRRPTRGPGHGDVGTG